MDSCDPLTTLIPITLCVCKTHACCRNRCENSFHRPNFPMQARDSTRSRSPDRYRVEFETTPEVSYKENLLLLSQRFKKTRENLLFRPGVKPQGFTVPTTSSEIMFNLLHDFTHDTHVLDLDTALKFQQLG